MIIYNNKKIDKLKSISYNDLYILTDFDGTITLGSKNSSWASIFKNPKVSEDFKKECIKIYNYYHKYELDEKISLDDKCLIMEEWYQKNIQTLIEYKITKDIIIESSDMLLREGTKEFFKEMNEKNIPVIIISAGVGDIIEQELKIKNCYFDNMHIISNYLKYENDLIVGFKDNKIIHPLNKNNVSLSNEINAEISNRNNILLFGNSIFDTKIPNDYKNIFKIGFLDENQEGKIEEFKSYFDVVHLGPGTFCTC